MLVTAVSTRFCYFSRTCTLKCLPSVLWRCWLGGRKGIRPVKTERWGASVVICLERGADYWPSWCHCHLLSLASIQIGFTFQVPAYPGSPGHRAMCACWNDYTVSVLAGFFTPQWPMYPPAVNASSVLLQPVSLLLLVSSTVSLLFTVLRHDVRSVLS